MSKVLVCLQIMILDGRSTFIMSEFSSWDSYRKFQRTVRYKFRFLWPPEINEFLDVVLATSQSRITEIKEGLVFWRAQIGCGSREIGEGDTMFELDAAYPVERMKPLRDRATDGRVNPKGIPFLYLATQDQTAIAEVRPWIGSYVSVAQFKVLRNIRVIDCGRHTGNPPWLFREVSADEREKVVWQHIDAAFSEPMTRSDDHADYLPTQIIAELFKSSGFDGVIYKSRFGNNGYNLALFDLDAADVISCGLHRIEEITYKTSEQDQPYFVSKYFENLAPKKL